MRPFWPPSQSSHASSRQLFGSQGGAKTERGSQERLAKVEAATGSATEQVRGGGRRLVQPKRVAKAAQIQRADCRHPRTDQCAGYSRTNRSAGIGCRFDICLRKSAAPVSLH